jgi:hypothetical protein
VNRTDRAWRCIQLAILVLTVGATVGAQTVRDKQESVLFQRMPGSTLDSLDRVEFRVVDERILLSNVWFERQAYDLSDGFLLRQTAPYETGLFVRQIIEHPLATSTVVVFPGEAADRATTVNRFLSVLEMSRMNPGRELILASEFADSAAPLSAGSLSDALDSGAAPFDLLAWLDTPSIVPVEIPELDDEAFARPVIELAPVEVTLGDIRAAARLMIDSGDPAMTRLMEAQVMDVVLYVEYAIQEAIDNSRRLSRSRLEDIDNLQIEFAILVGRADPEDFVFPDETNLPSRVRNILWEIDRITGGDTVAAFDSRLRAVQNLLAGDLVDSLHGALERVVAQHPEVQAAISAQPGPEPTEEERERARMSAFVNEWASRLPAGAIAAVEGSRETAYQLIELSLELSTFNVVLMSEAPEDHARTAVAIERVPTFIHPDLVAARGEETESIRQLQAFSEAHLENAIVDTPIGTVLVSRSSIDSSRTLVTMLGSISAGPYRVRHYLLPGSTPEELVAATLAIQDAEGLELIEAALLYRWAIVAQTALEL